MDEELVLDDDLTEMVVLRTDRVDGVSSPANGMPFLVMKSAGVTGTDNEGDHAGPGSPPAACAVPVTPAELMDQARAVVKAMRERGWIGREQLFLDAIKASDPVPGMASYTPPEEPDPGDASSAENAATGPDVSDAAGNAPGSPAWEADDSALLAKAAGMLADLATILQRACAREQVEYAVGAEADCTDVWSIEDAVCYVNMALGIVSRLTFTEAAEAGPQVDSDALGVAKATIDRLLNAADEREVDDMDRAELDAIIDAKVTKSVDAAVTSALNGLDKKIAKRVAKSLASKAPSAPAEPVVDGEATKSEDGLSSGGETPDVPQAADDGALDELRDAVKAISERLEKVAATPSAVEVALNGATPGVQEGEATKSETPAWDATLDAIGKIADPVAKADALNKASTARLAGVLTQTGGRFPLASPTDDTHAVSPSGLVNAAVPAAE